MNGLIQDIRHALRGLRKSPGFTATAVATVALAIGATVAIFSVVKTVLLDPLPYDAPEELVVLWEHNLPRDRRSNVANPGNVRDWRERSRTIGEIAAIVLPVPATLTGAGEAEEITVRYVTPNFFSVLGLDAARGRTFTAEAGGAEAAEVVLSHDFWQRKFGGDPAAVGRTLTLNGQAAVVVGVMPPEYIVFGEDADAWSAFSMPGNQTNTGRFLNVVGRLADGASFDEARREMTAIGSALEEEYPDFNGGWTVRAVPLQAEVVGDVQTALWVLFGATGLLLLIGCANVANLFLARATARRRELAVRTSLGATGGGLARLMLVESVVLAGLGAAAGIGLAHLGTGLIAGSLPDAFALPRVEAAGIDGTVLLFAVGVTVATGLIFGLAPALQARGVAPAAALAAEARGPSRSASRTRSALVVGEVALALMLLGGAMLLARSFESLTSVNPGLDPENVLTARVNLAGPAYQGTEPDVRFMTELNDRLERLPGVEAVGGVTYLPMDGPGAATSFHPADRPAARRADWPGADIRNVVGDYFGAMRIRLLRGRAFDERDHADAPPVAVVNRSLAESQWPDRNPIGRRVRISWGDIEEVAVVGVVENVHLQGLDAEPRPAIYLPYAQKPYFSSMHFALRSPGDPAALARMAAAEVRAMDPDVPLAKVRPMEQVLAGTVARPRMTATLMAVFAGLAALLAAVGLYGVLSYTVARRAREIGIRKALGARSADVLGLVTRQGMTLVAAGTVLGIAGALAGARLLESLLFGIESTDPVSLAVAAALLALVALAASVLPARRASRVEPMAVLREE